MGDEDRRKAELSLELLDLQHQGALRDHVERRCRLVHDHELGRERQGHRDHRPLPHSAAQLVRVASQVHAADADDPHQLLGSLLDLAAREALVSVERIAELFSDGHHRVERVHRALHHHRVLLPPEVPELGFGHRDEVVSLEPDVPGSDLGRGRQQPGDREQERGLAAARLADDAEKLPLAHLERHVVHGAHRPSVGQVVDAQVFDLEQRASGGGHHFRRLTGRRAGLPISSNA